MESLVVCDVSVITSSVDEYVKVCADVAEQYKRSQCLDSPADLLRLLNEVYTIVLDVMDIVIPHTKGTEKVSSLLAQVGGSLCYLLMDLEIRCKEAQFCPL
jgi:hypothetical protein